MAQDVITLTQAQTWAANWRKNPANTTKAFLIPEVDFTQIIAAGKAVNVRAYLGIDDNNENKLMLVGVDVNGNDLIDDKNGYYIYDFTESCPTVCDVNSPLY
jgi:hypothetical protein